MKRKKVSADDLLDTLSETAGMLVKALHEAIKREKREKPEIRSIKEWTGAAKELTALVKSLGEQEAQSMESRQQTVVVEFGSSIEFAE